MWSYYGSKSRVVKLYPKPTFDKIIEPFCGSARYSLEYFDRDVLLLDKYDVIIKVWKWLQQCSPADILGLPMLKTGDLISDYSICNEAKLFLGLNAGIASTMPRNKVSTFCGEQNGRKNKMRYIANNLYKIKHWKFECGDFNSLKNENACWFIDPPYEFGGHAYVHSKIDFNHLSNWCQTRKGQVIVCENMKATWLPFVPLSIMRGANMKHTTESIWTNYHTHFNNVQQKLEL